MRRRVSERRPGAPMPPAPHGMTRKADRANRRPAPVVRCAGKVRKPRAPGLRTLRPAVRVATGPPTGYDLRVMDATKPVWLLVVLLTAGAGCAELPRRV